MDGEVSECSGAVWQHNHNLLFVFTLFTVIIFHKWQVAYCFTLKTTASQYHTSKTFKLFKTNNNWKIHTPMFIFIYIYIYIYIYMWGCGCGFILHIFFLFLLHLKWSPFQLHFFCRKPWVTIYCNCTLKKYYKYSYKNKTDILETMTVQTMPISGWTVTHEYMILQLKTLFLQLHKEAKCPNLVFF